MRFHSFVVVNAVLTLSTVVVLHAEISWEKTALELYPELTDEIVEGEYTFTVTGDAPANIESIMPDCGGCTVSKIDKTSYAPGEKGVIKFRFSTIGREGVQQKSIRVSFGSAEPFVVLTFSVHVPYVFQARPRSLQWSKGSPISTQEIILQSSIDNASISDLLYDESKFTVNQVAQQDKTIKLTIVPKSTDLPLKEKIFVRSNILVGGKSRETTLYLVIAP